MKMIKGIKASRRGLTAFFGLVLVLIFGLIALTPEALAEEKSINLSESTMKKIESVDSEDYVYIFCNPLSDLRVSKLIDGAKATAETFNLNVTFFGPDKPYDAESVLEILNKVSAKSPIGIAMEIGHPSKFDSAIGNAVDNGIYFISFSMDDWTNNPRQAYVGYDWRKEGSVIAEKLFGDMPPLSDVLILDSKTKQGRSCHARIKGITTKLNNYNIDYRILNVSPNIDALRESVMSFLNENEVDGIVSLWGEITKPLAEVSRESHIKRLTLGGFGCGDFEKYVQDGSLDVLMKVITQLEGGIPLENLYYSSTHGVTPSTVWLHAKPVLGTE